MDLPVFQIIDSLREKYIRFLCEICEIESNSRDIQAINQVGSKVEEYARNLGLKVDRFPMEYAGDIWKISLNDASTQSPIILSSHMDTVFHKGDFGSPVVRTEGDIIYGPGVADCKGGIAIAMMLLEALKKAGYNKRPVRLLLQSEEEIGSEQSKGKAIQTIIEQSKGCVAFFNGESRKGNRFVIHRGGIYSATMAFHGVPFHSQNPFAGASPIREAAHKILELEAKSQKGGITFNCGTIQGGTSPNTVPGECRISIDIRYQKYSQIQEIEDFLTLLTEKSYDPRIKTEIVSRRVRPPMELNEKNMALFQKLQSIAKRYGLGIFEPGFSAGGSDAANVSVAGIPCIDSMGIMGDKIHTTEEYAYLQSMPVTAKLIAAFVYEN